MATFTKKLLTGSTDGKQILVTSSSSPGQTIHTAVAGTSSLDEVWLYAQNVSGVAVLLTLLWGGTTDPDNVIKVFVPAQSGRIEICDGMLLRNGLLVKAYAATGSVILVDGFVNNIA